MQKGWISMGMHKLFLNRLVPEFVRLDNCKHTEYRFDGQCLVVRRKGARHWLPARTGNCFVVNCRGDALPKVHTVMPPKNQAHFLMWAMGVSRRLRASTPEEYRQIIRRVREERTREGYAEEEWLGQGWCMTCCNKPASDRRPFVAMYMCPQWTRGPLLPPERTMEVLLAAPNGLVWPREFLTPILMERLGLTHEEVGRLRFFDEVFCGEKLIQNPPG